MADRVILSGKSKILQPMITQIIAMQHMLEDLNVEGSGAIDDNFDPGRRYHPLVRLHFREDTTFIPGKNQPKGQGQNRTKGEIRFRLMNETTQTLSEANLTSLGQKIKETFGASGGYIWNKGKEMYCYADWARGYQMQILARSEAQAKDLVTKILGFQSHTPQWKYLTKTGNAAEAERYPTVPQTMTILGKQVTLPALRPNAEVRFRYADCRVSPLTYPVVIYDRTGKKANALVR